MNPITPFIPGATITGELYPDFDGRNLDQDILQVAMPSGITIDVGWYPSNDANGCFKIVTYRDYWRDTVRPTVETKNPHVVAATVREIAEELRAQEDRIDCVPPVHEPLATTD